MGKWSRMAADMAASFDISDFSDVRSGSGPLARANVTNVTNVKAPLPARQVAALGAIRAELAGLDPDCPRGGIERAGWSSLVWAAADLFNDFAGQALGLGWRAVDLFGVVPDRPTYGGLVARVADGWRVVALDANRAAIRGAHGGSPGWYYRRDVPGSVLLWELPA